MDFSVIFDMDGVIIDSNPYHKKSWKAFCERHNILISDLELERKVFGRTGKESLQILFNKNLENELSELYTNEIDARYRELFLPYIKPIAGLKELLDQLKNENIKCAVATSAPPINVEFVMMQTGLSDYFKFIVDSTQITKSKPDPEVYLKTANLLETDPGNCIVIEDSLAGIESGLSAGMKVIGITTTHTQDELKHADLVIDAFEELDISRLISLIRN